MPHRMVLWAGINSDTRRLNSYSYNQSDKNEVNLIVVHRKFNLQFSRNKISLHRKFFGEFTINLLFER